MMQCKDFSAMMHSFDACICCFRV